MDDFLFSDDGGDAEPASPTIEGYARDLDGQNFPDDFGENDLLRLLLTRLDRDYVTHQQGEIGIDANADGAIDATFNLGGDFANGDLLAVPSHPSETDATYITYERFLPALMEDAAVDAAAINGFLSDRFFTGDGQKEFVVEFEQSVAGYSNTIGTYTIAPDGTIGDVQILFDNAKAAGAGEQHKIGTPRDGTKLGFFLIQDGHSHYGAITGDLAFVAADTGAAANIDDDAPPILEVDGTPLDAPTIFHALNPALNPGGGQQILSGIAPGGDGVRIGFEDLIFGSGDNDFNDVVIKVRAVYPDGVLGGSTGNDAPVAVADTRAGREDTELRIPVADLLANDSDPNGDPLMVTGVSNPRNGTVSLDDKGTADRGDDEVVFVPDADFAGTAVFDYTIADPFGDTAPANVSVDIAEVNDPPDVSPIALTEAVEDAASVTIDLIAGATDPEGGDLDIANITAQNGAPVAFTADEEVGTVTIDPVQFARALADGENSDVTVSFDVVDEDGAAVPNTAILRITGRDGPSIFFRDADGDGFGNDADTQEAYDRPAGFVAQGGDADDANAAVFPGAPEVNDGVDNDQDGEVDEGNRPPVATADTATIDEDTELRIPVSDLLANDSDQDGDSLTVTAVSSPTNGAVSLDDKGTADPDDDEVVFVPEADFFGAASFDYEISDGFGGTTTGMVSVDVSDVPDLAASFSTMAGAPLNIDLDDFFADAAGAQFALSSGQSLPVSNVTPANLLTFRPGTDDVGSYAFDVSAAKNGVMTTQSFALEVEADPVGTTRVSGIIQNTDEAPLAGVRVTLDGDEAVTDADGRFTITVSDAIVDNTLRIHAEELMGAETYPFIAERLPLLLFQDELDDGVNNVIDRPIFLPALDVANGVMIDPARDTAVTTPTIPGASVLVAANSLQDQNGDPFDETLSITEVPRDLTPAALPDNLIPAMVVTIQPGEMNFTTPAPLSLPNVAGELPGEELNLWSINPETGEFENVGRGRVSADGAVVETIEGGVRNSSWHFFAPRDPENPETVMETPSNQMQGCGCDVAKQGGNSEIELHSGAVIETHDLVSYQSLGETRGISLVYDSHRADPSRIVHFGFDSIVDDGRILVAELTLLDGGSEFTVSGAAPGFGLDGGEHFWSLNGGGSIDAALQIDMAGFDTGRYAFELDRGLLRFDGAAFSGTTISETGDFLSVNSMNSVYGAGWGIAGLQEIVENSDGSVMIVDGNGGELLFVPDGMGGFESPGGDFSTLEDLGDGTFRRTMTDQTVYEFDAQNRLASMTDRNGNVSSYEYDADGRLLKMIDPAGLETLLAYEDGLLASVTDPAARITLFDHDTDGNLIRVTDPDGSSRQWVYDGEHRMTQETDKRGDVESTAYDFAGRADQSMRKDGSIINVDPVQTRGLYDVAATTDPLNPALVTTIETTETSYVDANGRTITYQLDQVGLIISAEDEVGALPVSERNDDHLVTRFTDAKGNVTSFAYDESGNLTTLTRPLSFVSLFGAGGDALIINGASNTSEPGTTSGATDNMRTILEDAGATVTVEDDVPTDLSPFTLVLDIRFDNVSALTEEVKTRYLDYLGQGGELLVIGENSNFSTRNASVIDLVERAGGGALSFVSPSATQRVNAPFNGPNQIANDNIFYPNPGGVTAPGNGDFVTEDTANRGSAIFYDAGDLTAVADGELVVAFDINIFQNANTDQDTANLFRNFLGFNSAPETFTYDPVFNQLTGYTDQLGRQTLYEIDPTNGNTLSITEVIGAVGGGDDLVTGFTYTTEGLIDTITDPLGRMTDYDYTSAGLVSRITFAAGTADEASQSFEYDPAANLTAFVDENGNRTEYAYDPMGRLTRITEADPDGAGPLTSPETTFVYDADGNLIETSDAEGNTTTSEYDALDRLNKTVDPLGGETLFEYDPIGNLTGITDPNGNTTANEYDARDRLIKTTDSRGGETVFTYDLNDNLASLTDSVGNTTVFDYDARDRLERETDPRGEETTYSYDVVDNLISTIDRNGRQIDYGYDDVDRLVSENWIGDPQEITYNYDKAGNLTNVAGLFSALAFTYDNRDRVTQVSNAGTPGAPEVILDYGYDDAGNRIQMRETIAGTAAATTDYAYDALNRMTRITQSGAGVDEKRADIGYNALGQFASIERFSDVAGTAAVTDTAYTYDALNRVSRIDHMNGGGSFAFYDFEYDPGSRITAITDTAGRSEYAYDATDQLTGAMHGSAALADESYEYDLNGNRLTTGTQGTDYVTGPGNRLSEDSRYNYEYDNEGNLFARIDKDTAEVRTYTWDYRNRLIGVSDDGAGGTEAVSTLYTYDALDRRIAKTVDETPTDGVEGDTIHFVYDGDDVVLEFEEAPGGDPELARRNLHGPAVDQILAVEAAAAGETRWLHTDHLGTVKTVTDGTGAVVNQITYDSFGNIVAQTDATEAVRYAFTGREFDEETGQHFYRARYYDAETGRFASEDPIGLDSGVENFFEYASNAPTWMADPFGMEGTPVPPSNLPGGPYEPASGQRPGGGAFHGPKQPSGPRTQAQWVPPEGKGGSPGSEGYWKVKEPGQKGWDRYDSTGTKAITPDEAHPGPKNKDGEAGKKIAKKGAKGAVGKLLPPVGICLFVYDWYDGGFGHAVNEATWPASELWKR